MDATAKATDASLSAVFFSNCFQLLLPPLLLLLLMLLLPLLLLLEQQQQQQLLLLLLLLPLLLLFLGEQGQAIWWLLAAQFNEEGQSRPIAEIRQGALIHPLPRAPPPQAPQAQALLVARDTCDWGQPVFDLAE